MVVNSKKPITLRNNTNYFNPTTTKVKNTFQSPYSYSNRQQKIEGYETRLYWQFRYCEEHDGQSFFYTLTYNDAHMPKAYGVNCFDYEDLRDLLIGGFQKQLLRKYGTSFKYFIGAELGDGKGSRGMHNNPHYHCIFFLENAHNDRFPYVKISPEDFRHLVRLYWQGFDEDEDEKNGIFHDYREALKGIAREGENCGKVTDFRACMYCAKYVCKDAKLVQNEHNVERNVRFKLNNLYKTHKDENGISVQTEANQLARAFFDDVIMPMFNTPLNSKHTAWSFKKSELIKMLAPDIPFALFGADDPEYTKYFRWYDVIKAICDKQSLWMKYADYKRNYIEPLVKDAVNEWRNRYSNKVRISHGVGDYALDTIDPLHPTVQVPCKKGMKNRPIGMYYYRKLYLNVVKDKKGQNMYILNDAGKQYKLTQLSQRINKMAKKAENNISLLQNNETLFEKMRESDVNTQVFMHFDDFSRKLNYLLNENNLKEITERYAIYKMVYENRFFAYDFDGSTNLHDFPVLDYTSDYDRFLNPAFYSVTYNPLMLSNFLESPPEGYLPYSQHPYFLRFLGIFGVLDMCADYWFVQNDNKSQKEAEERAAVKRFHSREKVKEFYRRFDRNEKDTLFINE